MQTIEIARRRSFTETLRVDQWWLAPGATAIGLIVFFGYLTFRAFNATYVYFDPYISPTVAPPVFTPASGYPGAVPVSLQPRSLVGVASYRRRRFVALCR